MRAGRQRAYAGGASLAELSISIALAGLVLIPALMIATTWLSQRISGVRERMALIQGAALWQDRLAEDLSQTMAVSSESTDRRLCYAFFDPFVQRARRRCHLLASDGRGGARLSLQEVSARRDRWTPGAPFGALEAASVRIDPQARFVYADLQGRETSPSQASRVILRHWGLSRVKGEGRARRTLRENLKDATLPLASANLAGGSDDQVADALTQRASFRLPQRLAANGVRFSPDGERLLVIGSCAGSSTGGGLGLCSLDAATGASSLTPAPGLPDRISDAPDASFGAPLIDDGGRLFLWRRGQRALTRLSRAASGFAPQASWTLPFAPDALALDVAAAGRLYALDARQKRVQAFAFNPRTNALALSQSVSLDVMGNPQALAIAQGSGALLVLDVFRADGDRLRLFSRSPRDHRWRVFPLPAARLSPAPAADERFDIAFDDAHNRLAVIARRSGRVYLLIPPEPLSLDAGR